MICAPVYLDRSHACMDGRFQLSDLMRESRVLYAELGKLLLAQPMLLFYLGRALSATHAVHCQQHREWTGQYDQDRHCGRDEVRRNAPDAEPDHC